MDKLRALQYFIAAAEAQSLTGAARRLDVSVPAISKLVSALEASLDTRLFDRTARGLTLTPDGHAYRDSCQPLLEQLAAADESVSGASTRPRGTLVIGAPSILAQHCLVPALPRFHALYPDILIDVRVVDRTTDPAASAADVFVLLGWPRHPDFVHRRIAETRLLVVATPEYWAARGKPRRPADLEGHPCFVFRGPEGAALDLWQLERQDKKEVFVAKGWFVSNHRDAVLEAVLAGEGIARMTDLSIRAHLRSGRLVPVLLDWGTKDSPPVNLMYRANHRKTPRVRLFIDFVTELFQRLEKERENAFESKHAAERPTWYRRHYQKASSAIKRR